VQCFGQAADRSSPRPGGQARGALLAWLEDDYIVGAQALFRLQTSKAPAHPPHPL
jgi:hypothetical protein